MFLLWFALHSDNVNRKAFKESVKPGWHYFGRKMVSILFVILIRSKQRHE